MAASPIRPLPYPVSSRAYKRRDYEYIMSFHQPRQADESDSVKARALMQEEDGYLQQKEGADVDADGIRCIACGKERRHAQDAEIEEEHVKEEERSCELRGEHSKDQNHAQLTTDAVQHVPGKYIASEVHENLALHEILESKEPIHMENVGRPSASQSLGYLKGGLYADLSPPSAQAPVKKMVPTNRPRHAGMHHWKLRSMSWSLCFAGPVTTE